ncbi:condensation domain-containing protein [Saccharopolyspora sp. NPDC047091]|uniref:condensation domain-containing protein n=1 Tax=Saccharopolyspora sp. NPDC047091 TaxID=3155924 RepID=UPI0033E579AA
MRFTEIADYSVRPGEAARWCVSPPDGAEPEPDPRPPSHLQQAHVRARAEQGATSDPSWLAVGFDLDGPLDEPAWRTALLDWLDRHETLRSALRPDGDEVRRHTWEPGRLTVSRTGLGTFRDPAEASDALRELFNARTDPTSWPSFAFVTVSRADSCTVCLAFDHGNVDGYSILLVLHEIRELYLAARGGRAADLPAVAEIGSYVDFCAREREYTDGFERSDEPVARWAEFLADCGGAPPGFPLPAGAPFAADGSRQHGLCEWLVDADGAAAFEQACRRNGGSAFSGALAALALAAARPGAADAPDRFRALLLLHTRSARSWARSVGWFVGLAPVELALPVGVTAAGAAGVPDGVDLLDLLPSAGAALRRAKPLSTVPVPKVAELLGVELPPRFVVSYMDLRSSPGSRCWAESNARALHAPASSADEVYLWVMRSVEGIYVTSRFPGADQADAAVREYVARLRYLVLAAAATADPDLVPEFAPLWTDVELHDQVGSGARTPVGAGTRHTGLDHDVVLKGTRP